jgi:hypothetical protein
LVKAFFITKHKRQRERERERERDREGKKEKRSTFPNKKKREQCELIKSKK